MKQGGHFAAMEQPDLLSEDIRNFMTLLQNTHQNHKIMILKIARFLTIMFVSLSMAPAMCHLLEMPAKMAYDGALWLKISQTLYGPRFGTVGAFFEIGAVVTSIILVFMVRHHKPAFAWCILGAICMLAVHASFWIWIAPVNEKITAITLETLPTDWTALRYQWEHTHAARAYLHIVATGAVVISILVETVNKISTISVLDFS